MVADTVFARGAVWLARYLLQRRYQVVVTALPFVCLGVWGLSRLKIDQDLKALLPPESPSVENLERLRQRVGAQTNFIVTITSPQRSANIAFGRILAEKLRSFPELRAVRFRRNLDFFRENALLYLPLSELLDLRRRTIEHIGQQSAKRSGLYIDLDEADNGEEAQAGADTSLGFDLNWKKWLTTYLGGAQVPSEYFETGKGRLVVVRAKPIEPNTNLAFSAALLKKVQATIASLSPSAFHPDLKAEVQGKYAKRVGEVSGITGDISRIGAFALIALIIVVGLYFRSALAIVIVLTPVIVATILTLGFAAFVYGELNIVTTFIFAILLGLGIDFGIHLLSRYASERRNGAAVEDALATTLATVGPALVAGALTTISVFFLLSLSRFRGFSQFGIVAGVGVIFAFFSAIVLVPVMLAIFEPYARRTASSSATAAGQYRWVQTTNARGRAAAWVVLLVSMCAAALAFMNIQDVPFEYDFSVLGRKSIPSPAKSRDVSPVLDYRDAVGRASTWGRAVALCSNADQCSAVSDLLAAVTRLKGEAAFRSYQRAVNVDHAGAAALATTSPTPDHERAFSALREDLAGTNLTRKERSQVARLAPARLNEIREFLQAYLSLQAFVPSDQPKKMTIIEDIRRRVAKKRSALSESAQKNFDAYLGIKHPITADRLPAWVREEFRDIGGVLGRFIVILNGGDKDDYRDSKRIHSAFATLPGGAGTSVPVAANYFVMVEALDTLAGDGPVVITASALTVLLVLSLVFRSVLAAFWVLLPLLTAIGWLAGIFLVLGWKLNLYSVIVFPLLVGLAIDNGVHIFHTWQEKPSLRYVLSRVGGPIFLTTLTTFIGFIGLAFSGHVGIRTLGMTAGAGLWLGFLGSVVTLNAILYLRHASSAIETR